MPIKPQLNYTEFYEAVANEASNPYILLFSTNLKQIVVLTPSGSLTFSKTVSAVRNNLCITEIKKCLGFEATCIEATLLRNSATVSRFIVYHITIPISPELRNPDNPKTQKSTTVLTFAFPIDELDAELPIFCGLPVKSVGFSFIINANWDLVTSRENIIETEWSNWNCFLREASAKVLALILVTTNSMQRYFPKEKPSSLWWRTFLLNVEDEVSSRLLAQISSGNVVYVLENMEITSLFSLELLSKLLNATVVSHDTIFRLSTKAPKVDISYVLAKLCVDSSAMHTWVWQQENSWWQQFFRFLSHECTKQSSLVSNCRNALIFQTTTSCRINLEAHCGAVFVLPEKSVLRSWRPDLIFILPRCKEEEHFLVHHLNFSLFSPQEVISSILAIHASALKNLANIGTMEQVLADLLFIRDNLPALDSLAIVDIKLFVPTTKGLMLSPNAVIGGVLGFILPVDPSFPVVCASIYETIPKTTHCFMSEAVAWDKLLVKIRCRLPDISSLQPHLRLEQQFIKPFELKGLPDVVLSDAAQVLKTHSPLVRTILSHSILLKTTTGTTIPANFAYSEVMFSKVLTPLEILPVVSVPEQGMELAHLLDIPRESTLEKCLSAIKCIAESSLAKQQFCSEYTLEWLHEASRYVNKNPVTLSESVMQDVAIIILQEPHVVPLSQLYSIPEDSQKSLSTEGAVLGIEVLCSYLGKIIIDRQHNQEYYPVAQALCNLGCPSLPSSQDVILAIECAAHDYSNYETGARILLSKNGREKLLTLFKLLEVVLHSHCVTPTHEAVAFFV